MQNYSFFCIFADMRSQNELPQDFHKFPSQIIHFLGIPVFFVFFVLLYRPEGTVSFLDMNRDIMEFNLIMVGCILLGVLVATRLAFFFLKKVFHPSNTVYIGWCAVECLVFCLFTGLYMFLMEGKTDTYFTVVTKCLSRFGGILIWPYLIIGLGITLKNKNEEMLSPLGAEDGRLHFKDDSQKLKLVVAANSLLYIEAKENYVEIVYTDADVIKKYTLRSSMKRLEPMLHAQGLQRCHRAYYINPKHIKILSKDSRGYVFANLDVASCPAIPISKTYYQSLSALL